MSEMPVLPCKFEVELQTFKETGSPAWLRLIP